MYAGKSTKIVATIGPASDQPEVIAKLINAGVNVFRFNMKHGTLDWHKERIQRVLEEAEKLKIQVSILLDLQGPELRIETFEHQDVVINPGNDVVFSPYLTTDPNVVCISHHLIFKNIKVGDRILVDDGFSEFLVKEKRGDQIVAEVIDGKVIKDHKGVNFPGQHVDLPSLIEADLKRLDLAAQHHIDFIALSFCRSKEDVAILKKEMKGRNITADVIGKIENQEAVDNMDEIIEATEGIMIARGDLGIEVPYRELTYIQKTLIDKCRNAHKPVIVATQMLQSMIENPLPTRAEVSDVANAIFDGTDAIMLSGETASGSYPVKAVEAMTQIALFNEDKVQVKPVVCDFKTQLTLLVNAVNSMVHKSNDVKIDALVVFTETGKSARALSSYRLRVPLIAVTRDEKVVGKLNLCYGVKAFHMDFPEGRFELPTNIIEKLIKIGALTKGQRVIMTHGTKWREAGKTNTLTLIEI